MAPILRYLKLYQDGGPSHQGRGATDLRVCRAPGCSREVAAAVSGHNGTMFSPAYLWQLRTGAKDNPTMCHLEALARFFQVATSYFFDDDLTEFPDTEVRQLVASRNKTLRQMTVTLMGLSDESLNTVLNPSCHLRQLEGLPSPD